MLFCRGYAPDLSERLPYLLQLDFFGGRPLLGGERKERKGRVFIYFTTQPQ